MVTKLKIDQYSAIKIETLFNELKKSSTISSENITLHSANSLSPNYQFFGSAKYTPLLNAVIRLNKGQITNIEWYFDRERKNIGIMIVSIVPKMIAEN